MDLFPFWEMAQEWQKTPPLELTLHVEKPSMKDLKSVLAK